MELTKKEKKIIAQLLLSEQIQLLDDMIYGKKLVTDNMGYCDSITTILKKLKKEETIQGVITKPIVESVEMIVSEEDMDIIKKHLLNK
jgi:hypothetical protein